MLPRWTNLCQRLAPSDNIVLYQSLFTRLNSAYQTPLRAYHSLTHVADCLEVLDTSRTPRENPDVVEWSLWLHDCIYDPTRKDNEAASAKLSAEMLNELGLSISTQALATSLILATRHTGDPLSDDHALVADIDMSILATNTARYSQYAAAIRTEYSFVPEADYRKGRSAFLAGLLARTRIYHTEEFYTRCETAARANIKVEIVELSR